MEPDPGATLGGERGDPDGHTLGMGYDLGPTDEPPEGGGAVDGGVSTALPGADMDPCGERDGGIHDAGHTDGSVTDAGPSDADFLDAGPTCDMALECADGGAGDGGMCDPSSDGTDGGG